MAFLDDMIFPGRVIEMGSFSGDVERLSLGNVNQGGYSSQTNLIWQRSLRTYQAGLVELEPAETRAIERFWESVDGAVHGFRVQDPFDFQCALTEGVLAPVDALGYPLGAVGAPRYRMFKQIGHTLHPKYREIRKLFGNVVVQRGGVTVGTGASAGQCTVDLNTGIATFTADSSSVITAITVGPETQVTLAAPLPGLAVSGRLYITGAGGIDAALLNGRSHPVSAIAGSTYTLGTSSAGKTITPAGSGAKYPQPGELLAWTGRYHVPCKFVDTKLQRAIPARIQGGNPIVKISSLTIAEIRLRADE